MVDPNPDMQDHEDDAALMRALGQEVRAYVDERFSSLPEHEAAQAPVVNIAPATAAVQVNIPEQAAPVIEVNVPQGLAPIVNVETAAPIVNVAPAINIAQGATIEVNATAPTVNVAPAAVTMNVDHAIVAQAISDSSDTTRGLINALISSIEQNTAAIIAQTKVISSPKTIVSDAGGKPVGVKVGA